jgi:hypothetical protein
VLAGLPGDRSVRDVCREYRIAETLLGITTSIPMDPFHLHLHGLGMTPSRP